MVDTRSNECVLCVLKNETFKDQNADSQMLDIYFT